MRGYALATVAVEPTFQQLTAHPGVHAPTDQTELPVVQAVDLQGLAQVILSTRFLHYRPCCIGCRSVISKSILVSALI